MKSFIASVTMITALLVGEAFGECGWVLWQSVGKSSWSGPEFKKYTNSINWKIINAYDKKMACDAQRVTATKDTIETFKNSDGKIVLLKHNEISVITESPESKNSIIWRFLCLPGSLDPRD